MNWLGALGVVALSFATGCAAGEPADPDSPAEPGAGAEAGLGAPSAGPTAAEASTFAEQAGAGRVLFAQRCATCHGAGGKGGRAARLVGVSTGALQRFGSAKQVADFVIANMPPGGGSRLSRVEYYAIVGYLMNESGLEPASTLLDDSSAASLALR
jgi:cytochrome c